MFLNRPSPKPEGTHLVDEPKCTKRSMCSSCVKSVNVNATETVLAERAWVAVCPRARVVPLHMFPTVSELVV